MKRRVKSFELVEYPIDRAERIAQIVGNSSAVASSLCELKKRRAGGENVVLLRAGSFIFVGHPLSNGQ